jgi:hypothetical protein
LSGESDGDSSSLGLDDSSVHLGLPLDGSITRVNLDTVGTLEQFVVSGMLGAAFFIEEPKDGETFDKKKVGREGPLYHRRLRNHIKCTHVLLASKARLYFVNRLDVLHYQLTVEELISWVEHANDPAKGHSFRFYSPEHNIRKQFASSFNSGLPEELVALMTEYAEADPDDPEDDIVLVTRQRHFVDIGYCTLQSTTRATRKEEGIPHLKGHFFGVWSNSVVIGVQDSCSLV